MSTPRSAARRLRLAIFVAGALALLGYLAWFVVLPYLNLNVGVWGTPLAAHTDLLAPDANVRSSLNGLAIVAGVLLTQWLFLLPRRGWRFRVAQSGRPMTTSILVAGLMAMMLSVGLFVTFVEMMGRTPPPNLSATPGPSIDDTLSREFIYLLMAGFWLGWALVFWLSARQATSRFDWMSRVVKRLFAGSLLELFIATTAFLSLRKADECYCARGSYTGLVFGSTVLLWAFGPGIVLLVMHERVRQSSRQCTACGYDLRGSLAAGSTTCPECGKEIEKEQQTQVNVQL